MPARAPPACQRTPRLPSHPALPQLSPCTARPLYSFASLSALAL